MPEPTVSALILVHDGERHLGEAIESVLAQTRPVDELIVVDHDSSDRSAAIARGFGGIVRVVEDTRPGIGHARNTAVSEASGDYLAFLDHDDLWEPRKTELQLAGFAINPGVDLVFGHMVQFADDLDPQLAARLDISDRPQPGLHLGTLMATRSVWRRVGWWEGEEEASDGLVWFIRANQLGLRRLMLPDVVTRRRIHGSNQSFANHDDRVEWARALKASLDERRGELSRPRPGGGRSDA